MEVSATRRAYSFQLPRDIVSAQEHDILCRFTSATPDMMAERALLRRTDTKFLLPRRRLSDLLAQLPRYYGLVLAEGQARARYATQYFDTPDFDFFHDHRRGRKPRRKVRYRHYIDRRLSYLEVKEKSNSGTTTKRRQQVSFLSSHLGPSELQFIDPTWLHPRARLFPSVANEFCRITMVGLNALERVTIDLAVSFAGRAGSVELGDVAFAEIKQARFDRWSPFVLALRRLGVRASSASKYCIGTILLNPNIRSNRLRPLVRSVERITHV